jgi:hypothetical protein
MSNVTTPRLAANTAPTLRGKLGDAWLIDLRAVARRRGLVDDPRAAVTLPAWIASAPYAHPIWSSYMICTISLRETPGVPKAKVSMEGATHEVMVFAIDPDCRPAVDDIPRLLHPVNFAGQFIEPSDEAAAARVRQAVQDVIDGVLSPDTDFLQDWVQRFSGSNLKRDMPLGDHFSLLPDGSVVAVGTGKAMTEALAVASAAGADITAPTKQ